MALPWINIIGGQKTNANFIMVEKRVWKEVSQPEDVFRRVTNLSECLQLVNLI